jgi:hypothetical protein
MYDILKHTIKSGSQNLMAGMATNQKYGGETVTWLYGIHRTTINTTN